VRFRDSAPLNGLLFRNNSARQEVGWPKDPVGPGGARVVGNAVQGGMICKSGITFSHNVTTARGPCRSSDRRVASIGFVNATAGDLHLTSSSPAIDAGNPADHPARDFDRQSRPLGPAPDAGADELR
jgi:hypothetical protein